MASRGARTAREAKRQQGRQTQGTQDAGRGGRGEDLMLDEVEAAPEPLLYPSYCIGVIPPRA